MIKVKDYDISEMVTKCNSVYVFNAVNEDVFLLNWKLDVRDTNQITKLFWF